jgi:NAD-dependent SIR2 family protein deacetylase
MKLSEFIPLFPLRASNISWLFGAGTSVSAGLPTAYDLIWDFKRRIYCAEQGYELRLYDNLSDSGLRHQIQSYFDGKGDCPPEDSIEEYSFYFNAVFTTAKSRREYLDSLLSGVKLSYGHKAIGTLMKLGHIPLIFTTNFDKAFENAAVEKFKNSEDWFCANLDNAETGLNLFQSGKSPLIVKLHGDYFSEKLKNTTPELKSQDKKLRGIISQSCFTKGLGVMGYSGRDQSIMEILNAALELENSFPHGIFWFIRSGSKTLPNVSAFIEKAQNKGVEAHIIEIETFDTGWAEILKGFDSIPEAELGQLNRNYYRVNNRPLPPKGKRLPLLRFNAIPIVKYPSIARLYNCEIGGIKEVRKKISTNNSSIVAIRKKQGVIGFGSDEEFERVFGRVKKGNSDLYNIPDYALRHDDSILKNLIVESLVNCLSRNRSLKVTYRRGKHFLIIDPKQANSEVFNELKTAMNGVIGSIPRTKLKWVASLEITIQYKLNQAHIVMTPSILATKTENRDEAKQIAPFIKEFTANWYNNKFNQIFDLWLNILFGEHNELSINLFDENILGVNSTFIISKQTSYSKFS